MSNTPPAKQTAVIVGNGGHGCVLVDALHATGDYDIAGFVSPDKDGLVASLGVPWLGKEEPFLQDPAAALQRDSASVFIGIGDNFIRQKVQQHYLANGFAFRFPPLVHPTAYVALDVSLGDGCFVAAGAVVGVSATVGAGALINVNAVADHHSVVGDFASLAQNSAMGGGATIEQRSALGIGACLFHARSIGPDAVVQGGAVVNADVPGEQVYGGIPAKSVDQRKPGDKYL